MFHSILEELTRYWPNVEDFVLEYFIHFPIFPSSTKVVVKRYWKNGTKRWEDEYKDGMPHGKYIGWYENGMKWWKREWKDGLKHGKHSEWWENGTKSWKDEYKNGDLINGKHY